MILFYEFLLLQKLERSYTEQFFMHLHYVHVSELTEMTLELFVPFFHSVDLVFVVSLTRAS